MHVMLTHEWPGNIRELRAALKSAVIRAAELLGMGRTTLWRKLRQYGLLQGED